jgi:hypothetical protein
MLLLLILLPLELCSYAVCTIALSAKEKPRAGRKPLHLYLLLQAFSYYHAHSTYTAR